jgi:hypothetical protein
MVAPFSITSSSERKMTPTMQVAIAGTLLTFDDVPAWIEAARVKARGPCPRRAA